MPQAAPRSTPSEQDGSQGCFQREGEPVAERPLQQASGQRRRWNLVPAGARDNGQLLPQRRPPPPERDARVLPVVCGPDKLGQVLDSIAGEKLAKCVFATVKKNHQQHRSQLDLAVHYVIRFCL